MGDCNSVTPILEEEEENLIAAAQQHIAMSLETKLNLTDDAGKILESLGTQLSGESKNEEGSSEIEEKLNLIQNKIMNWEVGQSLIWDSDPKEAYEYVNAVEEARKLTESLEGSGLSKDSDESELLRRAHDVLHMAMVRLQEEFKLTLAMQPFETSRMSFHSLGSGISSGDDSVEYIFNGDSISCSSDEFIIDLIHPNAVSYLKCIANVMFDSNYDRECSQAFIGIRKDALDNRLFILEVENLSNEDVLKMEFSTMHSKIKKWIRAVKRFVRVYLPSEKCLIREIFGEFESISSVCFAEASKASMLHLLNFGRAIAIGPRQPEKLFRILDMYEVLADLIPDIDTLYTHEIGSYVTTECHDVLSRLGVCVKATFLEFENAVASNISKNAFAGGGTHPVTRYVMNYMRMLVDYIETLNVLLEDRERENPISFSPNMNPLTEEDNTSESSTSGVSPMGVHFRSLASILECNVDDKSKLYKDESLRHLFLMNNIHYMLQKVENTELRTILGDEWIRKHNWKFQQHAMNYERATWSSILSLLRDEGIYYPNSNSISKTLVKERLQSFYLAFEDVYKSQTAWLIPDSQLREDLRISTSVNVILAYRTFLGRYSNHISWKHIKYSADDLENCLLDLFGCSPKSLHSFHRK